MPEIIIESDYDQYFETMIKWWMSRKTIFHHERIVINVHPYNSFFLHSSEGGHELYLDFYYDALGSLPESLVTQIVEML